MLTAPTDATGQAAGKRPVQPVRLPGKRPIRPPANRPARRCPAYYAGVIRVRMTVSDLARTRFAYSGCITGSYQPTIVDGFFMMVKPLAPGFHTIVGHGTNTLGDDRTYNYRLTVTG